MKTRFFRYTVTRANLFAALAILALLGVSPADAASVYWDINGTTAGAGGATPSGSWNGANTFWNTDSTGGVGTLSATPGVANDGFFSAGTDSTGIYNITASGTTGSPLLANSLTFEEGTPTLSSGVIQLTKASSSSGVVGGIFANATLAGSATVSSGIQLDTATAGTLFKLVANNGSGTPDLLISGALTRSSTANTYNFRLGGSGSGRITSAISGVGDIQQGNTSWAGTWTIAGNQSLSTTAITLGSSGTFTAGGQLVLGDSTSDVQSWGVITINNNTPTTAVSVKGAVTSGNVLVQRSALQVSGLLSGATLTLGTTTAPAQGATLRLSDGTTAGSATFTGLTIASTGNKIVGGAAANGTLVLNIASGTTTVSADVTIGGAGANENKVALTKTGAGTLAIAGTHTYTGPTLVTNGSVSLSGSLASSITVSNGATLGGTGSTTGSVEFSTGVANFFAGGATAFTAKNFNVAVGGVVTVTPGSSTIVLQSTDNNGITGNFVLASGIRGVLSVGGPNNTQLIFSPVTLVWKGADPVNPTFWDTATANWLNGVSGDLFVASDKVLFTDAASTFSVAIQGASVSPGGVTFSNSLNSYTFTGAGIAGSGTVTKKGAGTVTLNNAANTFSGGLTLNAGSLVVNNLNQVGSLTPAIALDGGTLTYAGAVTATSDTLKFNALSGGGIAMQTATNITLRVGGKVTGAADWTKSGAGVLALGRNTDATSANDFTGKLTVTAGTVDIRHGDSLGTTAGVTEVQGATLMLQTFGQTSGSTITVAEPLVFSGTSYLECLNQEVKVFTDRFTGPLTNAAGGTLGISSAITTGSTVPALELNGNIRTESGSTLAFGRQGGFPVATVSADQSITVNGAISGPGSVTTEGTAGSVFTFAAANSYTGDTTIGAGTLALTGSGSIASTPNITIASGAILNVSAVSFALGAAQTLKGNGNVTGATTISGIVAPGSSIGTLTFGTAPTLNGTLLMEIDRNGGSPLADKVTGAGALGGTLTVVNIGATLQSGDAFDLLDGSLSGSFATLNLPGGASHWNTGSLNSSGIITFNGNNTPSASNFSLGVAVGSSVNAAVVGKYATDADLADTLTITSVSTPANGTATIVGGTNITYTSTANVASDSFTYTVSDGLEAVTRTVSVTTYAPEGFNRLSGPTIIGLGPTYSISFLGIPNEDYALEETSSLTPPITWTPVVTNTAGNLSGSLDFIFTPVNPSGFFRTRHVP